LLDRIVEASNPSVVSAYETRIAKLEREKLLLEEKHASATRSRSSFEEMFELALSFFANPSKLWHSGSHLHRRLAIKMTFADQLHYRRNSGFRT